MNNITAKCQVQQWGNFGSGGSSGSLPKSWWKLGASPAARRQGNNFANVGLGKFRLSNYSLVDSSGVRGGRCGAAPGYSCSSPPS